jgi:hypothetical protein
MPRRLILPGLLLFTAAQPDCPLPSTSIPVDLLGSANFTFAPAITALYLCGSASCSAGCTQLNSAPILLDGRCAPLGDSSSVRATSGGGAPAGGGTASLNIYSDPFCANTVFSSPSLALAGNPLTGCVATGVSGSGIFASGSTSPSLASVRVTQNAVELISPDGRLSAGGLSNAAQHKRYCVRSVVSVAPVNPGGSAWALLAAGQATLTVPVQDTRCAAARNHTSLWLRAEKFTPNTGGAAGNSAGCTRGPCMALNISALVSSMAPADPAAPPAAAATAPLLPVPSLTWAASASQAAFRCPPPTPLAGPSGPPGPLRDGQGPVAGATTAGGAPAPLPPLLSFPPVPAGWAGGVVVALSGGWLGALKGLDYDAGPAGALLAMEGDCIRSYAATPDSSVLALSLGGAGGGGTNAKCAAVNYGGAAGAAVGVSLPPGVAGAPPSPCGAPPASPPGSVGVAVRDFLRPWGASPSPPPPPPPAPSPSPWAAVDELACPRLPDASEPLARELFGSSASATFPADPPPCPAPPGACPPPPPPEPAVLSFAPATGVTWYSPSRKAAVALCPSSVTPWSQDAAFFVVEAPFSAIPVPMPWAPTCPVVLRRCILGRLAGGTLFAVMNETMRACDAFYPANYTRVAPLNAAGPGWAPPGGAPPPPATACEAAAMPELLRGHGWAANTTLPPRTFFDPAGRPAQVVLSAWGVALASPRGLNGSEVWRQCATAALDVGGGGLGPWALTLSAPPVGPTPSPPGGGGRCYLFARSGDDLTITEGPPAPEGGAACGAPAGWATAYAPFTYAGFYAAAAGGGALRAWPSQTPSPSATPSLPASPSATPTATISLGATASNTGSSSGSGTGTGAASGTASNSLSPTAALSPGASPSATPTCTGTLSTGASPSNSAAGAAGAAARGNAREVENAVGGTFGFLLVAGALALGALAWRRSAARRGRAAIAKGVAGGAPGAVVQMNPLGAGASFAPAARPHPPSLSAPQLPPGWIEQTDGVDVWFVDTTTGESHWEVPQPPPPQAAAAGGAAV